MRTQLLKRALWKYRTDGVSGVQHAIRQRLAGGPPPVVQQDPRPIDGVFGWLSAREAFVVVQIGAYVGNSANDPLHGFLRTTLPSHPASIAVLVEPLHDCFEALRETYGDLASIRLENVAIAEAEGDREFYRLAVGVDPTAYGHPEWLAQLGSLRADRMTDLWDEYERDEELKHFWHRHRTVELVHCWTLDQLFERHALEHVDLLQIDAEGYDYAILRTIDFSQRRPRFINYERILLQDDEPACRAMLAAAGYALFDWGQDTLAVAVADM